MPSILDGIVSLSFDCGMPSIKFVAISIYRLSLTICSLFFSLLAFRFAFCKARGGDEPVNVNNLSQEEPGLSFRFIFIINHDFFSVVTHVCDTLVQSSQRVAPFVYPLRFFCGCILTLQKRDEFSVNKWSVLNSSLVPCFAASILVKIRFEGPLKHLQFACCPSRAYR